MAAHRNFDVEQRRAHRLAKHLGVARVVGVRDQGNARADQLWSGGVDHDFAGAVRVAFAVPKRDRVVRAGALAVFEFCLRHSRTEIDIP